MCCRGYSHRSSGIFVSKVGSAQLGDPLACFSISIVILASGHESGSVDKQCNSSEVSSGDITGSSPPCGRYCVVDPAVPLLSCVWMRAALCTSCMVEPCWLTWPQVLTCVDSCPPCIWSIFRLILGGAARMSLASSSGDLVGSVLAGVRRGRCR